jgi:hypothetical protein
MKIFVEAACSVSARSALSHCGATALLVEAILLVVNCEELFALFSFGT